MIRVTTRSLFSMKKKTFWSPTHRTIGAVQYLILSDRSSKYIQDYVDEWWWTNCSSDFNALDVCMCPQSVDGEFIWFR